MYIDEFLIQRGVYTQATSVVPTLQVVRRAFIKVNSSKVGIYKQKLLLKTVKSYLQGCRYTRDVDIFTSATSPDDPSLLTRHANLARGLIISSHQILAKT